MVMILAPALNRALRAGFVQHMLAVANGNVMALYLWHMIPVVIVAIVGYPAGLLPQPVEGTGAWWLARLEWLVILSLVTAVEMVLLYWARGFFAAPLPMLGTPIRIRWAEPSMLVGAAMAAYGLEFVAADGFAPDGHFAWRTGLIFARRRATGGASPREGQHATAFRLTAYTDHWSCIPTDGRYTFRGGHGGSNEHIRAVADPHTHVRPYIGTVLHHRADHGRGTRLVHANDCLPNSRQTRCGRGCLAPSC